MKTPYETTPKARTTRRADGRITISGLSQRQHDLLVGALVTAKVTYQNADAPDADMRARFDVAAAELSQLLDATAAKASPFEHHAARSS